jgi:hypothetical protein
MAESAQLTPSRELELGGGIDERWQPLADLDGAAQVAMSFSMTRSAIRQRSPSLTQRSW